VITVGLHEYLDGLQVRIEDLHEAVQNAYITHGAQPAAA
jgi:uncharacterized alpha-E superfamily protein